MSSNFVDYVKVECRSGHGGAGSAHLRHVKFIEKGGPDGGDGGRGGHVCVVGDRNHWTLLHLKFSRHVFAADGGPGGRERATGADGQDETIVVPLGTTVKDASTGSTLFEITRDGQREVLCRGGRGGQGNWHFRTATHQTPRFAQPGEEGQQLMAILELKVLADVGLVGFPNAGKSTLLSVVSAAKPEIADYPFTTLAPNLGIVQWRDGRSFCMADIPGIIEGAAEGKGLGLRFLRHIERNPALLFVVSADAADVAGAYRVLLDELRRYNPGLLDKRRVLGVSKADLLPRDEQERLLARLDGETDLPPKVLFSAHTGQGVAQLKDALMRELDDAQTTM